MNYDDSIVSRKSAVGPLTAIRVLGEKVAELETQLQGTTTMADQAHMGIAESERRRNDAEAALRRAEVQAELQVNRERGWRADAQAELVKAQAEVKRLKAKVRRLEAAKAARDA